MPVLSKLQRAQDSSQALGMRTLIQEAGSGTEVVHV